MTEQHRRNSLASYFHRSFVKEYLGPAALGTIRKYQTAVTKLCLFVQHDVTLGEINDAMLDKFRAWLVREGTDWENARKYRVYIRRIVRTRRPGVCEKARGRRPHESIAVALDDAGWDLEGSLWHFFHTAYRAEKMVGCTDGSVEQIIIVLRRFCRFVGQSVLLTDLTDELVTGFMQWMLDDGYSRPTVNGSRSAILAVWRFAYRKKLVDKAPFVDKLKEHKRLPVAWSIGELERLLSACAATPGMVANVPAADYWPAIVLVMYDTGLRKGAVLSIERQHLDLSTGWLTVPPDHQKQKVEQRLLLSAQSVEAIRKMWLPLRPRLFEWPGCDRQMYCHLNKILTRANLPTTRLDKFHKLRKTCGSHICKVAGIDAASRQLGHSGEYVTRLYVDPTIAQSAIDGVVHLPRPRLNGH